MVGRTAKTSLDSADLFIIADSEDDNEPKKITAANVIAAATAGGSDDAIAYAIALG